jgi:hypothetical protein
MALAVSKGLKEAIMSCSSPLQMEENYKNRELSPVPLK